MQSKLIQQLNLCVWTIPLLQINYYKDHVQEAQMTRDAKLKKNMYCNNQPNYFNN